MIPLLLALLYVEGKKNENITHSVKIIVELEMLLRG